MTNTNLNSTNHANTNAAPNFHSNLYAPPVSVPEPDVRLQERIALMDISDYTSKAGNQMVRATFLWGSQKIYDYFTIYHPKYGRWAQERLTQLELLRDSSPDEIMLYDGRICKIIVADLKMDDNGYMKIAKYGTSAPVNFNPPGQQTAAEELPF